MVAIINKETKQITNSTYIMIVLYFGKYTHTNMYKHTHEKTWKDI